VELIGALQRTAPNSITNAMPTAAAAASVADVSIQFVRNTMKTAVLKMI